MPARASAGPAAVPIDSAAFARLMAPLGPFEPAPALAVGVSGGVDSVVLLALAIEWARARGGLVLALCVDHGLRPAARAEAARVVALAARLGAQALVLTRPDPPPPAALQAEARAFRLRALLDACAGHGVLHLLLAHHQGDQAETVLQRLARGSGPDGLAAMAPVTLRPQARILRPFLGLPKAALIATAQARGLDWDEDPSNANPAFERVRWRQALPDLGRLGLSAPALARVAARAGHERSARAERLGRALAWMVTDAGPGWLRLARAALPSPSDAPFRTDDRVAALAWAAASLAGRAWSADPRALLPLLAAPPAPGHAVARAGCLWRAEGADHLMVCRECRGLERVAHPLRPGQTLVWDGRFRVTVPGPGVAVVGLGHRLPPVTAPALPEALPPLPLRAKLPPLPLRATLPALVADTPDIAPVRRPLLAVPGLGWVNTPALTALWGADMGLEALEATFAPLLPLSPAALRVEAAPDAPYIPR
ncbi:tRNA lysidine(34) synthetase TilS [Pararhodospirillum oryzae]|uniref:tRNA(Ile)-lysidine synthase n=1 Tax=Pararhodospirillum oryzae TaxID=478448 RepID=A0A512H5L9_9PROT|nr:tRNA lysidine(34) synthetase TilS [Pararhodospirillum oryzae]GEO80670.1 tRNA(Ile)-lysidine synthase [Pararhodospirillum oryzae]